MPIVIIRKTEELGTGDSKGAQKGKIKYICNLNQSDAECSWWWDCMYQVFLRLRVFGGVWIYFDIDAASLG